MHLLPRSQASRSALAFAALAVSGCARNETRPPAPPPRAEVAPVTPAAPVTPVAPVTPPRPAPASRSSSPAAPAATTPVQWADLQEIPYDRRARFFAGVAGLESTVAAQVRELVAQRAALTGLTDTREWDFAMKEMESARSYLTSVGTAAGKAGRDLWDQEKAKVGRAWVSTQDAYGKVKSSTTAR